VNKLLEDILFRKLTANERRTAARARKLAEALETKLASQAFRFALRIDDLPSRIAEPCGPQDEFINLILDARDAGSGLLAAKKSGSRVPPEQARLYTNTIRDCVRGVGKLIVSRIT
jgi:hypothetical protein